VLKSGKSEDTLVHPDYRGKGITAEMYAKLFLLAKAKRYSMIWGFSHLRKEFFERAEMKVVYNSTLMYFPYNIFNTVRFILHQQKWSWKKRLGFFFKAIWSDQQTEQIEYSFIPLSLEEYGSKYEEMGSIYFRVPFKNTEFKQHFFYQITSKKTGESALLAFEELDHAIFISEIRMHSDFSPYDTETLMKAILSFLRAKNKLILFWAFNNPNNLEVNRSLRSIGFRNFKEGLRVCWKDLEEDSIHPNQLLISRLMAFHI
jgi:hypothetical protein